MQVESNNTNSLHNRARLFARIPASIDLRSVANCQTESWKANNQNGNNFSKPLHVKTSNLENALVKLGADGLPLGKLFLLSCEKINILLKKIISFFSKHHRSTWLVETRCKVVDCCPRKVGRHSWRWSHRWQI